MVFVSVGDEICGNHDIDALLHHRVAPLLPNTQFHFQIVGLVKSVQKPVLRLGQTRVVRRFLTNVVVIGPD